MPRQWLAVAKAEFLVQTARVRSFRKIVLALIGAIGIVWALYIAPLIATYFVESMFGQFQALLQIAFPGLMRSVILILWIMVLIYPISYSLQEIRIGQWEIMLSNNVSTKDMLIGMFLGKLPAYGLLVLFAAPVLMSPFVYVYQVPIHGQLMMYSVILLVALSTLWLSTVLSTAIQAKLGDSSRGNDLAKAFSLIVAVAFLLPLYSLMYFAPQVAQILGMDTFLVLPSTWGADLITWVVILTSSNIPASSVTSFEALLGFTVIQDTILLVGFSLILIWVGLTASDRLFTIQAGARTEKITTVRKENIALRGIRRIIPGAFGVLVVASMKDFGRKAQNISKLGYGMFLAVLLPLILNFSGLSEAVPDPLFIPVMVMFILGLMLGMIGAMTFGGIGFLDSKDQLWMLKGTPRGSANFVKARIVSYSIIAFPIALIPVTSVMLILQFEPLISLIMFIQTYAILWGAILVGIGITASNPAYEDTRSSAFMINQFLTMMIVMISVIPSVIGSVVAAIEMGNFALSALIAAGPLPIVGLFVVAAGTLRLSQVEA